MTDALAAVRAEAAWHLSAIHTLFTRDSKILVVIVFPETPQQNWMLGDATIAEAIAGLRALAHDGTEIPKPKATRGSKASY